jgi:hypothetical protein
MMDVQDAVDSILLYRDDIRSNERDMLVVLVLLGICLVFVLFVFGAWYMSTYGSVRGMVGGIASQGTMSTSLTNQYNEMNTAFQSGQTSYTYHWGGLAIAIDSSNPYWTSKDTCKNYVLDVYASILYNVYAGGDMGRLYSVAGSGEHGTYQLLLIVLLVVVVGLSWVLWDGLLEYLRKIGLTLIACGVISFLLLMFVSNIAVGSWLSSASSSQMYNESLPIVVSVIEGNFQSFCFLYLILGVILFAASYFMSNTGLQMANR